MASVKLVLEENHVAVLHGNPKVDVFIDQVTRFKSQGFEHSEKYKAGKWDGFTRLYQFNKKTFPIGLLETVEMQLIINDVNYEIIDNRVFKHFKPLDIKTDVQLRDYQENAVEKAIKRKRCLIQLPTGAGKTLVGIILTARLRIPTVFYVHKKELLYQTTASYKKSLRFPRCSECSDRSKKKDGKCESRICPIGIVGDGHLNIKPITIAMVQSAGKLPPQLFGDFGCAIIDECLHKTTKILLPNNKYATIKEIYENPYITHVMSYNEENKTIEAKQILRKIKTAMPPEKRWKRIDITYHDKKVRLLATANHKIWTSDGFKRADQLTRGDTVKWLMTDPSKIYVCPICGDAFDTHSALGGHVNSKHLYPENTKKMTPLINPLTNPEIHKKAMQKRNENLAYRKQLSERMMGDRNPIKNPETAKKVRRSQQKFWLNPENLQKRLKNYMNAPMRGRKYRDRNPTTLEQAIIDMNIPNLKYTGNGDFWLTINGRPKNPDFVVTEHVKKVVEVGDTQYWHTLEEIQKVVEGYRKIGWTCLYLTDKDLQNPKKVQARLLKFVNNHDATVTSLQKARGRPQGSGVKFNLEIEDNHNFFANGILVSNCHHLGAETFYDVASHTKSEYLFAMSATIRREDGKEMMITAAGGPVVTRVSISDLIRHKYLARPHIHAIRVSPIMFSRRDNWQAVYKQAIVFNDDRNKKIALKAVELSEYGAVYIHVKQIRHGEMLTDTINKRLLTSGQTKAVFIHGNDSTTKRNETLDLFRKGELPILVSTLLGEGVDLPNMYALILASGGLSRTFVIQVVGRLLRISKHDIVLLYDIADQCKYLYDHWIERVKFYQSEEEFILEEYVRNIRTE